MFVGRQLALNPPSSDAPLPVVPAYETFGPSVSLSFTLNWSANATWRDAVAKVDDCTNGIAEPVITSGVNVVTAAYVEPESVKVCLLRVSVALAAIPRARLPFIVESGLGDGPTVHGTGGTTTCGGHVSKMTRFRSFVSDLLLLT